MRAPANHRLRRRRALGLPAALLLGLALCLLWPVAALAHSELARAIPNPFSVVQQSPDQVTIWFTEAVDPNFSSIKVLDSTGKQVDNGDSARYQNDPTAISVTLPPLANGTYTVAWRNTSTVDGHSLSGSFIFTVQVPKARGAPAPAPPAAPTSGTTTGAGGAQVQGQSLFQSPLEPVVRWIAFLSILAIVGSLAFELFITRPVILAAGSAQAVQRMGRRMASRTLNLAWAAAVLFLAASTGELMVKTSVAKGIPLYQGLSASTLTFLGETNWGHLWLWRVGLALALIGVLAVASAGWGRDRLAGLRTWHPAALAVSAGILLTLSLASHGAALAGISAPAAFTDYLHLLAGSFWVGGVVYLALVAPPAMRAFPHPQPSDSSASAPCPGGHANAFARFSGLAMLSAGVLAVTGLYSSWAEVNVVRALATPYGISLLAKVALVVALAALGAVNLLWVRPRLTRDGKSLRVLHGTVAAQAGLAAVVLLSAGTLVSLNPGRQAVTQDAAPQAIVLEGASNWAKVSVQVSPGQLGPNRFIVTLRDLQGRPVTDVTSVGLFINYLDADLGPYWQYATPVGGGQYALDTDLSVAGPWNVQLSVQTPNTFDVNTSFPFTVPTEAATVPGPVQPSVLTGYALFGIELAAIALLVLPARWVAGWGTPGKPGMPSKSPEASQKLVAKSP